MTQQLRQTLHQLRKEKKRADDLLEVVIPIGAKLSSEKDFNRLLEEMLLQTKAFCHADAGTLFLRNENDQLQFVIVRNDTLNLALGGASGEAVPFPPIQLHDPATGEPNQRSLAVRAALAESSINVAALSDEWESDVAAEGSLAGSEYRALSVLAIPLRSIEGNVLGVMQLINAKDSETGDIIPFDAHLQQMLESFSSLAVAALESYIREQKLHQQIEQLRIEIDERKRQRQVSEIVETDFFQDLQQKARGVRSRRGQLSPEQAG
jgi:GAF domain-containing protein